MIILFGVKMHFLGSLIVMTTEFISVNTHGPQFTLLAQVKRKEAERLALEKKKEAYNSGPGFFCAAQEGSDAASKTLQKKGFGGNEKRQHDPSAKNTGKERIICLCQGVKHGPLANCLNCGKINCKEEGYGPCLFCGNVLNFGNDDENLINVAGSGRNEKEILQLQRAIEAKNRLVLFDKEASKRTKVFDDASDWFSESVNPWLSQAQRKKAESEGTTNFRKVQIV